MSFDNLLVHTCTIEQNTGSNRDSHGKKVPSWSDLATSVACRLENPSRGAGGREFVIDKDVTMATHRLFLLPDQTVTERHRISSVTREDGTTLLSQADIVYVDTDTAGAGHHKEVWLKEVRT